MQGDSSSAESKAGSGPDQGYKCQNCSRVFNSSRARGGHQIAHRKKRPIRRKRGAAPISPILAAVLAHHISSDDDDAPPMGATKSTQTPAGTVVQQVGINSQANEAAAKQVNDAVQLMSRSKNGSSQHRQPCKKPSSAREKPRQHQVRTKDLLGLWNPMGGSSSEGSCDKITLDLFTSEPKDESDELDLELALRSKNTDKVSLKLKLGF